jgi:transaldolase / glucose-6-phosphate isomerase
MNPIEMARELGQSIWYDDLRRGLLVSGGLQRLIDQGISGLTSNPSIFEKAIAGSDDYDQALSDPSVECQDARKSCEGLMLDDVRSAADLLRPVFERSGGEDGYASLEPDPDLAYDAAATIKEARRLFAALGRPNVMIKVPATPQGIVAIRQLIGEGININATLIFSLEAYRQVREAYIAGLEDLARRSGGLVGQVCSVASFFVSRVDTAVDPLLEERIRLGQEELRPLLGKAAVANCRLAYQAFKNTFSSRRFSELEYRGACVQRVLWASTSTKNAAYSDLLYVETLVGHDTVNTMPGPTLTAFLEHGRVHPSLEEDFEGAERVMQALDAAGISMEQVTARLLADGVRAFSDSQHKLLDSVEKKKARLFARDSSPGASRHDLPEVESAIADLKNGDVVSRIWRKDFTVWKPEAKEISDRLGWLSVGGEMRAQVPRLKAFAQEVSDAGFTSVVVLGMGGSSLGAEVIGRTFNRPAGYPELIVLDSTVPACVQSVAKRIDLAHSLFIVSSKSGDTIEPTAFYRYFRKRVENVVGTERAGRQFVAITDPGSPLEVLAQEQRFRRTFLNAMDIGGRYSVLSYFGLVPMALIGMDVAVVLDRAERMRMACTSGSELQDNPGAWLGALLGGMARNKRDKLTLVASPGVAGFGPWVEQLIAESTGKQGRGIVPITGEPLASPASYGDDRFFVYLRLEGDGNVSADRSMERIRAAGHPVVRLDLKDKYALGGEFFRWEFATAVAGSILGIHPFDQPNVQKTKDLTAGLLAEFAAPGELPHVEASNSLQALLEGAAPGNYLSIMAYVCRTSAMDRALAGLRRRIVDRYRIATTAGYGPRYLHSTGQLHKGGPGSGLFLIVTAGRKADVEVPGAPYSFGALADAQALGDLWALQEAGRKVARIHLESASATAVSGIASKIR